LQGSVGLGKAIAVQAHGFAQALKVRASQLRDHTLAAQLHGEVGRPQPMLGILVIVVPLGIMQKGKPGQYRRVDIDGLRKMPPMKPNPRPVRQAVHTTQIRQSKLRAHHGQRFADDLNAACVGVGLGLHGKLGEEEVATW
jgi:hypothetical protein